MAGRTGLMRILVIHPGALGDTLLALPVMDALKRRYEPATLDLLGTPSLVGVLPGRSIVDSMRSIDGPEFLSLFCGDQEMPLSVKRYLSGFDLAVAWCADTDGAVTKSLAKLLIPKVIVGSPALAAGRNRHATARFGNTLHELGLSGALPAPLLVPTDDDRKIGWAWLRQAGINAAKPIVAVHPGSGSSVKCWPVARYASTIADLLEYGANVIVIEGPSDREALCALQQTIGGRELPRLTGDSLTRIIGVLAHCGAFLGNDSGLTHLAAGLRLPTVAVFGPTDPSVWAPRGEHVFPLRGEAGCRCLTRIAQRQCLERSCIAVSPEAVSSALQHALERASASLAT